jgi:hypothetical protein
MLTTTSVRITLSWWPPEPDAPLGIDHARELVAALKPIIGPVVDAAEADVRTRVGYDIEVRRSASPVRVLAIRSLSAEMTSLCLGIVYQTNTNPAVTASIQIMRDGTVTSRRER